MKLKTNCGNQFFYTKNRELIHLKSGDEITTEMLKNFDIPPELVEFDEPETHLK
jgi:hypothetical protein